MKTFVSGNPERLVRVPEVLERIGVSYQTIWRWERANGFPKRRKIGSKKSSAIFWLASEIDAFIEGRWEPEEENSSQETKDDA